MFIVKKDGTITHVKTKDFPGTYTAAYCEAVIQNGPKWKPAMKNGRVVASYKTQPIILVADES